MQPNAAAGTATKALAIRQKAVSRQSHSPQHGHRHTVHTAGRFKRRRPSPVTPMKGWLAGTASHPRGASC